jgi:hypothetical protein
LAWSNEGCVSLFLAMLSFSSSPDVAIMLNTAQLLGEWSVRSVLFGVWKTGVAGPPISSRLVPRAIHGCGRRLGLGTFFLPTEKLIAGFGFRPFVWPGARSVLIQVAACFPGLSLNLAAEA